jgi:hypothetical protein
LSSFVTKLRLRQYQAKDNHHFGPATGRTFIIFNIPSLSVSGQPFNALNQIHLDKHHLYQQYHHHQCQDNRLKLNQYVWTSISTILIPSPSVSGQLEFFLNQQLLDMHHLYRIFITVSIFPPNLKIRPAVC